MSHGACEQISSIAVDDMMANGASYLALMQQGAAPGAFLDLIAQQCPPALAETLFEEFTELPLEMVNTIFRHWAMAQQQGIGFEIHSVRPDSPLEFARRRMTRLALNMSDDGISVEISHVPGRHAAWQREAVAALA